MVRNSAYRATISWRRHRGGNRTRRGVTLAAALAFASLSVAAALNLAYRLEETGAVAAALQSPKRPQQSGARVVEIALAAIPAKRLSIDEPPRQDRIYCETEVARGLVLEQRIARQRDSLDAVHLYCAELKEEILTGAARSAADLARLETARDELALEQARRTAIESERDAARQAHDDARMAGHELERRIRDLEAESLAARNAAMDQTAANRDLSLFVARHVGMRSPGALAQSDLIARAERAFEGAAASAFIPETPHGRARALIAFAAAYRHAGDLATAGDLSRRAVAMLLEMLAHAGAENANSLRVDLANAYRLLGDIDLTREQHASAARAYRDGIDALEPVAIAPGASARQRHDIGEFYNRLGQLRLRQKDHLRRLARITRRFGHPCHDRCAIFRRSFGAGPARHAATRHR